MRTGTHAVTTGTDCAKGSGFRSIADTCTIAGGAAWVGARPAFTFRVAAQGIGGALAQPGRLVARHAGAGAGVFATHPIHAEARGAGTCAGACRAVLCLAIAAAVARLCAGATASNLGSCGRLKTGTLVTRHGTRLADARARRDGAADAVHAEARGAGRRRGGCAALAIAKIRDLVLPDFVELSPNDRRAAEEHLHTALAVKGRCPTSARAAGKSPVVPGLAAGVELPDLDATFCLARGERHDLPSAQSYRRPQGPTSSCCLECWGRRR